MNLLNLCVEETRVVSSFGAGGVRGFSLRNGRVECLNKWRMQTAGNGWKDCADRALGTVVGGQSFEVLFGALETPLLRYARHLLPDDNMAEEIVQEAFVRLHAQSDTVRDARSWLFRTVHNLALNHRRKMARIVRLDQSSGAESFTGCVVADPGATPDEELLRIEGIGLVRLVLEGLDKRSRELIML
ncbi:MAG: RNA polymerase sigma factor, partial [Verrucomicrobiae bacterium]|nr:RNA polymerase sigma factor [Verrucomicrobiae bacterium]